MNLYAFLMVGMGGFAGSVARYATVRLIDGRLNSFFPYGTFAVNVTGSLILGIVIGVLDQPGEKTNLRLLLTTGFCGGFTTFSSFAFENINLINQKLTTTALLYTLLSIVIGFIAVACGVFIGRWINNA
jgi:CrcB protein